MANESAPDNPLSVDFVPEGAVATHRVSDGEDWASVAAQYNVKVDDLIYFNFHTNLPEEVNWYLRRNTGCTVSNDGGLNWAFSSSAEPGLIYIPPSEVINMQPLDVTVHTSTITLKEFLRNADIGVSISGNELHIIVSLLEHLHAVADALDVVTPTIAATEGVSTIGVATVGGATMAVAGPVLGMAGVFMALGSGYEEAREEIHNKAIVSGFSQGFVAGLLSMSPVTVSSLFAEHGVIHRNVSDADADVVEMKALNRGLAAGYAMANTLPPEDKKSYLSEIREFTGDVPVAAWTDRDKINYVIEYAAKLRLHFLQENQE